MRLFASIARAYQRLAGLPTLAFLLLAVLRVLAVYLDIQFVGNGWWQSLGENSHCAVPSGLDLRETLPGTPVPGYRLSRPSGTDSVG
jgi:hypothetical protein